jgi:DHA1 family bicyclomycin/chloramphenicol resistance-like MFS transporter
VAFDRRRHGWRLSFIVALLAMLAPFSIDTYLPSFPDIGRELGAGPVVLQQTLSLYLLAFAAMMLVYGPLSDAFGRRRVVLAALGVYVGASAGCALAASADGLLAMRIGQGLAASAGLVIGRAVVRDVFAGAHAQRVLAQVMLIFGLGPALAPILGGWLHAAFGWRAVFWFLAALGFVVWVWAAAWLPETLARTHRQPARPRAVAAAYRRTLRNPRFMLPVAVTFLSFGGFFLYVAGAPDILYRHLGLGADQFGYLFVPLVAGLMAGAFLSGRAAGRLSTGRTVAAGFALMVAAAGANLALATLAPPAPLAVIVPPTVYATGMALAMPTLTLLALDCYPHHRGLASAVQGFAQTAFNAAVAGALAPLVSANLARLAATMLALNLLALVVWLAGRRGAAPAP